MDPDRDDSVDDDHGQRAVETCARSGDRNDPFLEGGIAYDV